MSPTGWLGPSAAAPSRCSTGLWRAVTEFFGLGSGQRTREPVRSRALDRDLDLAPDQLGRSAEADGEPVDSAREQGALEPVRGSLHEGPARRADVPREAAERDLVGL